MCFVDCLVKTVFEGDGDLWTEAVRAKGLVLPWMEDVMMQVLLLPVNT